MRAFLLVLLLAGCTASDSAERWAGTVDTLGNGAVQVTNPATGLWGEGGSGWQLERELELGSADGPEPLIFATVSGIEADADGRIYVLDREANQLRIFTGTGEHVRTVGREGAGPGEYRNANGLVWLSPDTLLVVDQRGMRYSILDREGTFVRSVPRQLGFYGRMFAGGIARGRIYERSYAESGPKPAMVLVGTSPALDTAAARDTVWLPEAQGPVYESYRLENSRGTMSMQVPFTPTPVYHVDPAGRIWHGHGSAPRLVRTAIEGDTTIEVLLDATPAPVTSAEIAEWEAGGFVKQFRERGGLIDMDRIPKVKPFFDGLIVDPEGNLWLSIPASPIETKFAIVDSSGRYLGRVQASGFRRNAYVPPVVRNGRLYLTGFDELDVPKVYVFRIAK